MLMSHLSVYVFIFCALHFAFAREKLIGGKKSIQASEFAFEKELQLAAEKMLNAKNNSNPVQDYRYNFLNGTKQLVAGMLYNIHFELCPNPDKNTCGLKGKRKYDCHADVLWQAWSTPAVTVSGIHCS